VFDLSRGQFDEVMKTYSRLQDNDREGYTQVLDRNRTLQTHGQRFCATKTTIFEGGEWFQTPHVTHPCYERGFGVSRDELKIGIDLLSPLW
jgi:hypothetical protein